MHKMAPTKLNVIPIRTGAVARESSKKMNPAYVRKTSLRIAVTLKASGPAVVVATAIEIENI